MDSNSSTNKDEQLWQAYVDATNAWVEAGRNFQNQAHDKLGLIRSGLKRPEQRGTAMLMARTLTIDELKELFDDLIGLAACLNRVTHIAQELIWKMPHEWLIANIEAYAEVQLQVGDYETYRAFLVLYDKIDRNMAIRLAQRAIKHTDVDIIEEGQVFLDKINTKS